MQNLHVSQECVGSSDIWKLGETDLGDDSTKFTGSSRNTVSGGTISGGEDLSRNNKGGGVGSKVLEEVGKAVKEDECLFAAGGG